MANWKAQQLLQFAATLYQHQKESYSRVEIVKKLNEIKYLTSQKKVPRLSLRKEIIHLESQLQAVFELEKKLALQKKKQALVTAHYKRQIAQLKKHLQAAKDKDLRRKVDKLSYLLGDSLAKSSSAQEVQESESQKQARSTPFAPSGSKKEMLLARIAELKARLEQGELSTEVRENIRARLALLEEKLQEPGEIKHTLLFEAKPPKVTSNELPSPPPPRRT